LLLADIKIEREKPLASLSTFGIGGNAKLYAEVRTIPQMQAILAYAFDKRIRYHILGKGSNTLFDDKGFCGLVIQNKIEFFEQKQNVFFVGAGFSFALLGVRTAKQGWSGLEFASGIPASVGGAVFMNAGAGQREVKDALFSVHFVDERGKKHIFQRSEISFAYRYSSFQKMKGAIVGATFRLEKNPKAKEQQKKLLEYRLATQPYKDKSVGCVFQNPTQDCSAGQLIEQCGLKGFQVGGAKVSPVHANFIINDDGAKAEDILKLIAHVKSVIKQQYGVDLSEEFRCIPYQEST
jgi:UDP-N-acetylmuramate dehydrogenase